MANTIVRKQSPELGDKVAQKLNPLLKDALSLCPADYVGEITLTVTANVSQGGATCVTLETLGTKQRSRR